MRKDAPQLYELSEGHTVKTVAERFVGQLGRLGISWVFGIPGGAWVDYMEALRPLYF